MKVLFLNDLADPRIGSSVRQMYQHARVLRAGGHETALLTAVQDPAQVGETEILGMRVLRVLSDYPVRFRSWVSLSITRGCESPSPGSWRNFARTWSTAI